jgi:hypothetical protein
MPELFKYPRTGHLPHSPGAKNDDRILDQSIVDSWVGTEVVISEKRDGENTTLYTDDLHARSLDSSHHPSRTFVKAIHGQIKADIPEGWRICGENLTAVHSIRYEALKSYFEVFSIWDANNFCLSWGEMEYWCRLLELEMVPVLYHGFWPDNGLWMPEKFDTEKQEGFVVRPYTGFHFEKFGEKVGKWVRKDHIQTDEHWMSKPVEYNGLEK